MYQYDYTQCQTFSLHCNKGYKSDEFCLAQCRDKETVFNTLNTLSVNFLAISNAATELLKGLTTLYQAHKNMNTDLY